MERDELVAAWAGLTQISALIVFVKQFRHSRFFFQWRYCQPLFSRIKAPLVWDLQFYCWYLQFYSSTKKQKFIQLNSPTVLYLFIGTAMAISLEWSNPYIVKSIEERVVSHQEKKYN